MKPIFNELSWFMRRLLAAAGLKRKYLIGVVNVRLDYTHRLPDYQAKHPYYDRFLPHLAKNLTSSSIVVDVGANIGDTVAAVISANSSLECVCIEADKGFYRDLLSNIDVVTERFPNAKIHAVNKFIGKEVSNVWLEGAGGTKHAVIGVGDIDSDSLSEVFEGLKLSGEVSLLKTDVDGFDYDVIRSSEALLRHKPLIYFECQNDNEDQLKGYLVMLDELMGYGYRYFALFDNFGQYLITLDAVERVSELLRYLYRQNSGNGTRTIYYFDILACGEGDKHFVERVIDEYLGS